MIVVHLTFSGIYSISFYSLEQSIQDNFTSLAFIELIPGCSSSAETEDLAKIFTLLQIILTLKKNQIILIFKFIIVLWHLIWNKCQFERQVCKNVWSGINNFIFLRFYKKAELCVFIWSNLANSLVYFCPKKTQE